jgi:hypothetical protein
VNGKYKNVFDITKFLKIKRKKKPLSGGTKIIFCLVLFDVV